MNKNINLCEILRGHEGETFYSSEYGVVTFDKIFRKNKLHFRITKGLLVEIYSNGSFVEGGKCTIFPSKDQLDWNGWIEEQNSLPE